MATLDSETSADCPVHKRQKTEEISYSHPDPVFSDSEEEELLVLHDDSVEKSDGFDVTIKETIVVQFGWLMTMLFKHATMSLPMIQNFLLRRRMRKRDGDVLGTYQTKVWDDWNSLWELVLFKKKPSDQ